MVGYTCDGILQHENKNKKSYPVIDCKGYGLLKPAIMPRVVRDDTILVTCLKGRLD